MGEKDKEKKQIFTRGNFNLKSITELAEARTTVVINESDLSHKSQALPSDPHTRLPEGEPQ